MRRFPRDRVCGKQAARPCALLWDESFLWGLMAFNALTEAELPFDLLRGEDIRQGALSRYRMLFVPGGWASNKLTALGEQGCEEVRRFVAGGGGYLGICGGAGLATEDGIGLLTIGRKPSPQRVRSFSGAIRISLGDHAIWRGVETPVFTAWWPSQFRPLDPAIRVLARYGEAQEGAFSSDIPVEDGQRFGWSLLEERYGILLDPDRLHGEPAVVEGRHGSGAVILSLLHFDTPDDRNGTTVLRNLWEYLAPGPFTARAACGDNPRDRSRRASPPETGKALDFIETALADLMAVGERNFLWRWRNPFLLQWRRGVRGLEYNTLAVMIAEIRKRIDPGGSGQRVRSRSNSSSPDPVRVQTELVEIKRQIIPFVAKAKRLLVSERFALQRGPLSPLVSPDEAVQRLRQELFGSAMSHGGEFKPLIDAVDRLLFSLIKD